MKIIKLKVAACIFLTCCLLLFSACSSFVGSYKNNNLIIEKNPTPVLIDATTAGSQIELLETVSPAVVGIYCKTSTYDSIGTGVAVLDGGYVVTNNHVIEGANSIRLYLYNGNICSAKLLWRDIGLDIAVLKSDIELPYLMMAEANSYKTGEDVFAIGTPIALQFKHTATKGMISAVNRTLQIDTSEGLSTLANLIQHDASINPGNSGGPLINTKGEVIGINTAKITDAEGMGFAVPIEIVKTITTKIKADGKFDAGFMGVFGYDASINGFDRSNDGVYLVAVSNNSPAERLGLKRGDIIKKIDDTKVNNLLDLRVLLYNKKQGDEIKVTYLRDDVLEEKVLFLEGRKTV